MPHRCVDCSVITGSDSSLCPNCWKKYIFIDEPWCRICGSPFEIETDSLCLSCLHKKPPYTKSRSLFKFNENSRLLIHKFKYHDRTYLVNFFASLLYSKYKSLIDEADIITCVPMHKMKRLFRLYNHSHMLAKEISKISGKEFIYEILHKSKYTKSQAFLSKLARKENLKGSIICKYPERACGKKIVLIDDVITTGSTINLCSRVLSSAGAKSISVISIAKTYL